MSVYYANEMDEYLAHYGVKGMKWGKHLSKAAYYARKLRDYDFTGAGGRLKYSNKYKKKEEKRIKKEEKAARKARKKAAYKDVLRSKQGYTGGGGGGYFNSRSKTKKKKKKPFLPFSRPLRARKKNDVYRAIKRMKAYKRAEHLKKG